MVRGPGGVVEPQLGEGARPLGGDRPEAEQLADRGPRFPGFAAPADVAEDFGVHRELDRLGDADRLGERSAGRRAHDHAGDGLAGGELRLFS
jgi:hypothetical protein